MALNITITNAGRAEIINADNTGTGPVEITHIAFTETVFAPSKSMTALPDEIKRVDSIAGEVVADDTISVTAKDEGTEAYTVRGFGLITEFGTLFAVYGQEEPIIEKSAPTTLLLTTDIILADLPTASLTFGDISFSNPPASLTIPGVVTLSNATDSSAQNQAATPLAVKTANDNANTRLAKSQNLADVISAAAARVNLGLGTSATLGNTASRTSASTEILLQAAAMNDHRTSADHDDRYPQRANNLSDLPSAFTARANLGLGASATMGTTASRTSTSTSTLLQAKAMNDHRQSDDHDGRYPLLENTGSAAAFNAQVSVTDTAPGRLMQTGAFGLGGRAPSLTAAFGNDLNTPVYITGFFDAGGAANRPAGNGIVQQIVGSLDRIHQIFYRTNDRTPARYETFKRYYFAGAWSGWSGDFDVGQNIAVFSSVGVTNWTVPAELNEGRRKAKVTVISAGAGGGRRPSGGGGGGGGAERVGIIDLEGVSSVPITVGAAGKGAQSPNNADGTNGGASSFGAYISCTGGIAGDTNAAGISGDGVGGDYGGGYSDATSATVTASDLPAGGNGGGPGGAGTASGGRDANAPGGGGGGAVAGNAGDGADGIIIVEW